MTKIEVIDRQFVIRANVWEMYEGDVKALELDGVVFKSTEQKTKPNRARGVKESYLSKWIRQNNKKIFNIIEFKEACPKFKRSDYQRRLDKTISKLISENKILQLGNNAFKVIDKEKEIDEER